MSTTIVILGVIETVTAETAEVIKDLVIKTKFLIRVLVLLRIPLAQAKAYLSPSESSWCARTIRGC